MENRALTNMTILLILAAFWGFMFVLCLALVTANGRMRLVHDAEMILPDDQRLEALQDIALAKTQEIAERRSLPPTSLKQSVFVIDDDPDILRLITHVLKTEGFDVHSFTNPEEALQEFKSSLVRPGMVVTDFAMQPMNGLELISRCRESAPQLKTIVISGMVDENWINHASGHPDRFLAKPFPVASLVETLNDTLAAHN